MDDAIRKSVRKLIIGIVIGLVVLLSLYLTFQAVEYGVYAHFVTKVSEATGLNDYLVQALSFLFLAPFIIGVRYCFFSPFSREKRKIGASILISMAVLYNAGLFVATHSSNFNLKGEAIRYYAITPDGVKYSDKPGVEPGWGIPYSPVTPNSVKLIKRIESVTFKKVDPAAVDWFDPNTGDPKLWFCRPLDGDLEFYNRPGFHPFTRDPLKPVTKELYQRWAAELKRRVEAQEKERQEQDRIKAEEQKRKDEQAAMVAAEQKRKDEQAAKVAEEQRAREEAETKAELIEQSKWQAKEIFIPKGTEVNVSMITRLSSESNFGGNVFKGTLAAPIDGPSDSLGTPGDVVEGDIVNTDVNRERIIMKLRLNLLHAYSGNVTIPLRTTEAWLSSSGEYKRAPITRERTLIPAKPLVISEGTKIRFKLYEDISREVRLPKK